MTIHYVILFVLVPVGLVLQGWLEWGAGPQLQVWATYVACGMALAWGALNE